MSIYWHLLSQNIQPWTLTGFVICSQNTDHWKSQTGQHSHSWRNTVIPWSLQIRYSSFQQFKIVTLHNTRKGCFGNHNSIQSILFYNCPAGLRLCYTCLAGLSPLLYLSGSFFASAAALHCLMTALCLCYPVHCIISVILCLCCTDRCIQLLNQKIRINAMSHCSVFNWFHLRMQTADTSHSSL